MVSDPHEAEKERAHARTFLLKKLALSFGNAIKKGESEPSLKKPHDDGMPHPVGE